MASISTDSSGNRRIHFFAADGVRKAIRFGKLPKRAIETIKLRIEFLLAAKLTGSPIDPETAMWVTSIDPKIRAKLAKVNLVEPLKKEEGTAKALTLDEHVENYITIIGARRKPGTVAVWRQVQDSLKTLMPSGIELAKVTRADAFEYYEKMQARGIANLTLVKHVRIAKQFMEHAVDAELIERNPFDRIKLSASIPRVNVEVSREIVDRVLAVCDLPWRLIVSLSRFGGLRCPSEVLSLKWEHINFETKMMTIHEPKVEHLEGRGLRPCPIFPELLGVLEEAYAERDESKPYVVDKPMYRQAANTGQGWKNANLRQQLIKKLNKLKITPWARLFHSMRASRQTELEKEFPIHVVCAWLGNSPKVAARSYLLVTEADINKAIGNEDSKTAQKAAQQASAPKGKGKKKSG